MLQVATCNWKRFNTEEGRDMRKEATWMPSLLGSQEETAQPVSGGGPNAEWITRCLWNKIDLLHIADCFLANLWLHAHGWKGQGPLTRMRAMVPPFVSPWSQTVVCKLFFFLHHLSWWILTAAEASCSHDMLVAYFWQALSHSQSCLWPFQLTACSKAHPSFRIKRTQMPVGMDLPRSSQNLWVKCIFMIFIISC